MGDIEELERKFPIGAMIDYARENGLPVAVIECCPALKMTMTPSLSMKTKMVALVATLTG